MSNAVAIGQAPEANRRYKLRGWRHRAAAADRDGGEGGIRTPGASEGTRDFESRRLNLTPEPLRN